MEDKGPWGLKAPKIAVEPHGPRVRELRARLLEIKRIKEGYPEGD